MIEEKTEEAVVENTASETKQTPAPAEFSTASDNTEEGGRRPYRPGNNMNRRRKKVCQFCADKTATIDYKEPAKLKKYTSERGKILPRRVTGACAYHQREVTRAIKLARVIALLPYTTD